MKLSTLFLRTLFCAILAAFALCAPATPAKAAAVPPANLDLSGQWRFALDPGGKGLNARWFAADLAGGDTIALPGTTDIAKKGTPNSQRLTQQLTRRYKFVGKAWYQRDITIPEAWKGRRVVLTLERTKGTTVWFDDTQTGPQQTFLSVPHRHVLTVDAAPGKHRLTVLVDNSPRLFPAGGHMIDEDIQTNWNGIIGRIFLKQTGPVWVERVQAKTDSQQDRVTVEVTLAKSPSLEEANGWVFVAPWGADEITPHTVSFSTPTFVFTTSRPLIPAKTQRTPRRPSLMNLFKRDLNDYPINKEVPPEWSEWQTKAEMWFASVTTKAGDSDSKYFPFAARQISHTGSTLRLNGKPIFLRGKHDALAFPLTGAPPMDKPSWLRYFARCKEYGINHIRYHSACPPRAAFAAADELGLYIQVENPARGNFARGKGKREYQLAEARAILDEYGNHPSFVIYALGNELGDDPKQLASIIADLRQYDGNRRIFATGSNNHFWRPAQQAGDDLWVTFRTAPNAAGAVRGSYSHADLPLGHIEAGPPNTMRDFSTALKNATVPVIGHEVGQYQVFPNFDEIPRYTGVLEARNFEVFRDRLNKTGMGNLWRDFFRASFETALLCYKEDIEAALRTPGFGGFQLLDLQDFQAQGTALVGVLDAFMEPKAADLRERWAQFCSPTVPLAMFEKFTYNEGTVFTADIKVAHYGEKDFKGTVTTYLVGDGLHEGRTEEVHIKRGEVTKAYTFYGPDGDGALSAVDGLPDRLTLSVTVCDEAKNLVGKNSWVIWDYPNYIDADLTEAFQGILVTHDAAAARTALDAGKKVLLLNRPEKPLPSITPVALTAAEAALSIGGVADRLAAKDVKRTAHRIKGLFMTDFWNFPMFNSTATRNKLPPSPGTLGILCDPKHPLFAEFPTEFHTNWQWWNLIKGSDSFTLDGTPADFRPIVQVIDNFARNHKIGLIFEGCAGKDGQGQLLVCCIDEGVLREHPEGRQLLMSMAKYMKSPAFAPKHTLPEKVLEK